MKMQLPPASCISANACILIIENKARTIAADRGRMVVSVEINSHQNGCGIIACLALTYTWNLMLYISIISLIALGCIH